MVKHYYFPTALETNGTLLDTEVPTNRHSQTQNLVMEIIAFNYQASWVHPTQDHQIPRKSSIIIITTITLKSLDHKYLTIIALEKNVITLELYEDTLIDF